MRYLTQVRKGWEYMRAQACSRVWLHGAYWICSCVYRVLKHVPGILQGSQREKKPGSWSKGAYGLMEQIYAAGKAAGDEARS